jgi:hypothetical protein
VLRLNLDLEDRLPSSDSPIPKTAADEETSDVSNASVEQQISTNGSQSVAEDTKAARADLEEPQANAQEQNPKMHTPAPTISVTVSSGNMRIDLGTSTGDNCTLSDLPEFRPLTPTNGVAAEARAAIACGSKDSPHLLDLPGGSPDTSSLSGTTAIGENDNNPLLESATGREEFSPAFRLRICKTAVSCKPYMPKDVC